jgi:predicted dehydrogenase
MTNLQKIKVAVVGGGAFGEEHLRTFASMPQIEIGGVYTLENARGEELCARYGGRNYESLQALAEDGRVELVSIATPENQHLEPFNLLAQSGKAIYVEKPLASTLKEARQMLELSKSILAMSGHCLRFEQRLATVFEKLRGVPKYHFQSRNRRTRIEKETYGRVHPAYSMLCHEIELSNAFAESTFERVVALETKYSEGQVDGMSILIEYENGMTSCVEGGWYLLAQNNCVENDFVSVLSANGVDELSMPHLGYYQIDNQGLKTPNLYYGYSVYGTEYGPLRAAFDYFVDCIQQQKTPQIATIQDAYNAVELIEAALKSVQENRWVSRDEIVEKKL